MLLVGCFIITSRLIIFELNLVVYESELAVRWRMTLRVCLNFAPECYDCSKQNECDKVQWTHFLEPFKRG